MTPKRIDNLADLKHDPANANRGTERGTGMLERSLRTHGAGRSILTDRDGVVIAGNKTLEQAAAMGLDIQTVHSDGRKLVVVVRDDLSMDDTAAKELAIFDNRAGELNLDWDASVLQALAADIDLSQFFRDDELDALLASLTEPVVGLTDPDDVPPVPEVPTTKPGDLWMLGRHKIYCADSKNPDMIAKLLDGAKPDLAHLDPPYGIGIVAPKGLAASDLSGGSKPFGSVNNANRLNPTVEARRIQGVTNGVKTKPSAVEDRTGPTLGSVQRGPKSKNQIIQANIYPVMQGDDDPFQPEQFLDVAPVVIMWGANYFASRLPESSCWICWDKREGITRNSFADCELAWCSKHGPSRVFHHLWNGLHKGSQHGERRTHPTEKPVALYEEIGNFYAPQGIWLDLFAGTGAQVIAAERTGATCYACEIEPQYVDVIVKRCENFTGLTAVLAHDHALVAD